MPYDRVRPLKLECPAEGGTAYDMTPTETSPNHGDGLDAGAYFLQATSTADSTCYADRDPADGGWRTTDSPAGTRRQADLISRLRAAFSSHQALPDVIHFLPEGPGDGWASGAYRQRIGTAPNSGGYIWWSDASQTRKIVAMTLTYPAGNVVPSSRQWQVFNAAGTVVVTVTDTLQYTGPLMTACIRTWT